MIEGVQVQALVDTGSMRSFISDKVHTIFDFDNSFCKQVESARFVSITGDPLDIKCSVSCNLNFCKSKYNYRGSFLVSSNIRYDCVLGWDFLVSNKLELSANTCAGKHSYFVKGPHGVSPILSQSPSAGAHLAGVARESSPQSSKSSSVLTESKHRGAVSVTLLDNISVPPKSEIIVEGKVGRSAESQLGMVSPLAAQERENIGVHVAYSVSQANCRTVPVRIANTTEEDIELAEGSKLAQFSILAETPIHASYTDSSKAAPVACSVESTTLAEEIEAAIDPSLSKEEKEKLRKVLLDFSDVFADTLGHTTVVTHSIDTGDSPPIKQRPRRLPYAHREEADRQIKDMLAQGVIEPSDSPWSSSIVLVKRKDGQLRFCIDFRQVNSVSQAQANPLPRPDDILDSFSGAKLFSTLDLRAGYWQVSMNPVDKPKTAFTAPGGLYQFCRMPFGLNGASSTFQRMMEIVLSGLNLVTCLCYLDDVIIHAKDFDQHCARLAEVLARFRQHNLRVKISKCKFAAPQVSYLGHIISANGISPDPAKVVAVQNLQAPRSVKEVRSFLGLAGYYRKFLARYASVAAPLTNLTKKDSKFIWTEECEQAFQTIKNLVSSAPVLQYPKFDREFILTTDASDFAVAAILSQIDDDGTEKPVAFSSQTLDPRERNYNTTEKEAYAIVFGVRHFRVYLLGKKFRIVTDHRALKWLNSMEPKGRIARWIMDLQEFQFEVEHRPGTQNTNADALSRLEVSSSADPTAQTKTPKETNQHPQPITQLPTVEPRHPADPQSCAVTVNPSIDLKQAQKEDKAIAAVMECKNKGLSKPDFNAWASDPILRNYWHNYDRMFVRNQLLVRLINRSDTIPRYAVVVPQSLVQQVLSGVHDNPFMGHLGVTKTVDRLRHRFFWPHMRASVEKYIRECSACAQRKNPIHSNKAPTQTIDVGQPFTFWALDYMGPLPETARGNKHILVIMDHFTKWCEAVPTKDQKASTVAPILINKIFSRFGPPTVLHSDQGANFESNLMHEICDVMGITKTRTTAYHPSGDGQVERQNRTLQNMLSAFASKRRDDWDLFIDPVVYAYNSSRQESTGISPYEVVFGQTPRLPLELELGVSLTNPGILSDYSRSVRETLKEIRQLAKENLSQVRIRQMESSSSKVKSWSPYTVGQTVWLRRPKQWKLGPTWIGPYTILTRVGQVNYKVESDTGKISVVHHNHLKPYFAPTGPPNVFCPSREHGDLTIVENDPSPSEPAQPLPPLARPRPARLRQQISRPTWQKDFIVYK